MVTPNSTNFSFDELASLTIANYSDEIRDNVSNNIPTYAMFDDEGGVLTADGGTVLSEQLDFGDNSTFKWFSGYEELSLTPTEAIGSAHFDWKECNANVIFNRREIAINSGASKRHDLIQSKSTNAERTIINNLGAAFFYAGTESDGKALGGFQYLVADDPTTGTVGGINRATAGNEFWRNQVFDESVDSITLSATTIQDAMELLYIRCTRGMDVPNLWIYGNTYWRFFAGSVNVNQRYVRASDGDKAKVSFPYYVFKNGTKVFHDPNCGATRGYAINTKYLKFRPHSERNIKTEKPRYPAGQASTVIPIDFMGNFVCGNASLQGVMHP
jgi:hypothetical protein